MSQSLRALVSGFLLVSVFLLSGCASSQPTPTQPKTPTTGQASGLTRNNDAGQVVIEATWQREPAPDKGLVFKIVMDTHSVDLDSFDLSQLASLRNDKGQPIKPTSWDAPKGGHHRSGALTFPLEDSNGTSILKDARYIELVIRDVAGVAERVLRWEVGSGG